MDRSSAPWHDDKNKITQHLNMNRKVSQHLQVQEVMRKQRSRENCILGMESLNIYCKDPPVNFYLESFRWILFTSALLSVIQLEWWNMVFCLVFGEIVDIRHILQQSTVYKSKCFSCLQLFYYYWVVKIILFSEWMMKVQSKKKKHYCSGLLCLCTHQGWAFFFFPLFWE